jgi:hypothetical protein
MCGWRVRGRKADGLSIYVYVGKNSNIFSVQISAQISRETRDRLENYSRAHGIKKQFLIENALLHFLLALDELPARVILPPRLVVTRSSGRRVASLISGKRKPTRALVELMSGDD